MRKQAIIKTIKGEKTTLAVTVIVNAANRMMLGGGGMDGYPIEDAAEIAGRRRESLCLPQRAQRIQSAGRAPSRPQMGVIFCRFSERDRRVYEPRLNMV